MAAMDLGQGGESFSSTELSHAAHIQTIKDQKRMSNAVSDLVKAGEMKRVSRGVYLYVGKQRKELPLNEQMRNLLKIKKTVTVDELIELGVSKDYAQEWLLMLVRRGVVTEHANGNYELVADMEIPATNEEKAEKLRRLRAKKKMDLQAALQAANKNLTTAMKLAGEIE